MILVGTAATILLALPTCVIGKPCGNTCISAAEVCHINRTTVFTQPTEYQPSYFERPQGALKHLYYVRASEFNNFGNFQKLSRSQYAIEFDGKKLVVTPDATYAFLNDKPIVLNAAPVFYQMSLFIPLKAVSLLGCTHDALEKKSSVTMKCAADNKPRDIEWAYWDK